VNMNNWQDKVILVIGAARQGLAASRFLAAHGAKVILTDNRPQADFVQIIPELLAAGIQFHFGGHPLELLDHVDLVCISGGVPLELPIIQAALEKHIPLTNDSQILMEAVKAKVIGITGSAGKTTTTTLIGEIAKAAIQSPARVWVGGNIGFPLIEHLEEIRAEDWVVVELSSFQLELMTVSPHIAVVLNVTPNHLDRHKNMQAYSAAKAHILEHQQKDDYAILNRDDAGSMALVKYTCAALLTFGFEPLKDKEDACFIQNDRIVYQGSGKTISLISISEINLPGRHNLANALAACTAACAAGFSADAMRAGIRAVKGIPHRLELVRERNGVRWINDSIATAPERVTAAIHAIQSPLVLLLGGRDKDLPWNDLAALLHERKPKVILFGEAGSLIMKALQSFEKGQPAYSIEQVSHLSEAIEKAAQIAQPGESILLSPGGTSFDEFKDFEERGDFFRKKVEELS
jgi:UDP-N-acetylmuramoylalanine--D-glutamate ligase